MHMQKKSFWIFSYTITASICYQPTLQRVTFFNSIPNGELIQNWNISMVVISFLISLVQLYRKTKESSLEYPDLQHVLTH